MKRCNGILLSVSFIMLIMEVFASFSIHAATDGSLKWKYDLGVSIGTSPAVGSDGTVYISAEKLYAFYPTGKLKWTYMPIQGRVLTSPVIGQEGNIYVMANDQQGDAPPYSSAELHAVGASGKRMWLKVVKPYQVGSVLGKEMIPSIDFNGVVYVPEADAIVTQDCHGCYVLKYSPAGTYLGNLNPSYSGFYQVTPSFNKSGYVAYGGSAATDNRGVLYYRNLDIFIVLGQSPVFGSEDKVIYATDRGTEDIHAIYAVNGNELWQVPADSSIQPVVGPGGNVCFGITSGLECRGGLDGAFVSNSFIPMTTDPAIGKDGTIYYGSDDGLYAFDGKTGEVKWSFPTPFGKIASSPVLDTRGTLYFGSDDGTFYALNTTSGGLSTASWPMYRHDARHSNCAHSKCLLPQANLAVTTTDSKDPVKPGESFTYTVTITNNGPTVAKTVLLDVSVDKNLTSVSATGCTYKAATQTLNCSLGDLAKSQSAKRVVTVKIKSTVKPTSTVSIEAMATSLADDPTFTNNKSKQTTKVVK